MNAEAKPFARASDSALPAGDAWKASFERAVERCREGRWDLGLQLLGALSASSPRDGFPALYYSYLGRALARCEGRHQQGIRLCEHALKLEFYQLDAYVNLAHTCLLAGDRQRAARAVLQGLEIDDEHPELLALRRKLGTRRPPVIRALSRGHFLNRLFGRLRHDLARRPVAEPPDLPLEDAATGGRYDARSEPVPGR